MYVGVGSDLGCLCVSVQTCTIVQCLSCQISCVNCSTSSLGIASSVRVLAICIETLTRLVSRSCFSVSLLGSCFAKSFWQLVLIAVSISPCLASISAGVSQSRVSFVNACHNCSDFVLKSFSSSNWLLNFHPVRYRRCSSGVHGWIS